MDKLLIQPDRYHKIPPLAEGVLPTAAPETWSSVSLEILAGSSALSHSHRVDVCGGCPGGGR